ncbi:ankyrin repeat-containing domain protein [Xylaria bambusicola]|uniref:ankyrin repeat-containing domain protein n=1 Tax=Xylaria bambusicola TaxID=326684 RepID=UPI0020079F85|nr:ankyrin repeat-containing domain protein [Xylaria bambusicola]KAI0520856.1 ankyrin repeat-containing domain protein [Xylaria bambusicola]
MPRPTYYKGIRKIFHFRNRGKAPNQGLEIQPQLSTAEANDSTTIANVGGSSSSNPSLNPSVVAPSQTVTPTPKPPLSLVDGDNTPIRELWNIAYEKLRIDDKALVLKYEKLLDGDLGANLIPTNGSKLSLRDRTHGILQRKMDEVNAATWKLKFGTTDVEVREIVKPVLGVVSRANNFISAAASGNPYTAIAWMGVSVLLPLLLNPSEQISSLVEGVDYISSLITHSWMWEDLYARRYESDASAHNSSTISHVAYKKSLEELYRHILKFQARSYCYYSHNTGSRLGLDILKWNEWDSLLSDIKEKENAFSEIRKTWQDKKFDEECEIASSRHEEAMRQWRAVGGHISGLREAVQTAQNEKHRDKFIDWLCRVDPSEVHNVAQDKHQKGTCDWLVRDNEDLKTWQVSPSSMLWLHGKPGCGKSVLSSSVIQHLADRYKRDPGSPVAYFFFSFTDSEKQKVDTMLSSLIRQLYMSRPDKPEEVEDLSTLYKEKCLRPDSKTLENALLATTRGFSSVSLVIDALDECPTENEERSKLLASLGRIITEMPDNVHLFVTSRAEPDISAAINPILTQPSLFRVAIDLTSNQNGINHDISLYIDSRLASGNPRHWPDDIKSKAKDILLERADGMFQYIVYQFQALEKHNSKPEIYSALEKLPVGLHATYDSVLRNLDPEFQAQVVSMLKWLVASARPLLLEELAETWILRPEDRIPFDVSRRLFKPQDAIKYASNLIISFTTEHDDCTYVRLAHFSVKEYLVSNPSVDNISPTTEYSFSETDAHLHLAHSSLSCHLYRSALTETNVDFKLKDYTAEFWPLHLERVPCELWPETDVRLAARALRPGSNSLRIMIMANCGTYQPSIRRYWKTDSRVKTRTFNYLLQRPHCYASRRGFPKLMEMLLPGGLLANTYLGQRSLDETLESAAYEGMIEIVQLLLDRGARFGSALQIAVANNQETIVELLLQRGANPDGQCDNLGSALQTAVNYNQLGIVKLLLKYGAQINSSPNAGILVRAVWREKLTMFLLDNGANIDSSNSEGETALYAVANHHGQDAPSFRLLLERGANANAQGGYFGNPLQALIARSRKPRGDLVKLLLDKGADVNAQGGKWGNALQAACFGGRMDIVQLLLDRGADINAQGGVYGSALQAACCKGSMDIVQLLLDRGADINAQGGYYGNALQAACCKGSMDIVQLLLDQGADINAQGGYYGNALQAACCKGSMDIVQLLLDQGAACSRGKMPLVQHLLDRGADVKAQGGCCQNALQAAAGAPDLESVKLLLQHNADVNQQGGWFGTALYAACVKGVTDIARMLLDHGADIHAQGGSLQSESLETALEAACRYPKGESQRNLVSLLLKRGASTDVQNFWLGSLCCRDLDATDVSPILKLLLDHRVDINGVQEKRQTTTLQSVIEWCDDDDDDDWGRGNQRLKVVGCLLENGANANIGGGVYGFPLQSACSIKYYDDKAMYLLQACPDLDIHAVGGLFGTALQAAAYSGHTDVVKILLQRGVDPNVRGGKYRSALNAAVFQGHWYIVEMLLDKGAVSDRDHFQEPDEKWLSLVGKEKIEKEDGTRKRVDYYGKAAVDGEVAVERYRIFWERQPLKADAV